MPISTMEKAITFVIVVIIAAILVPNMLSRFDTAGSADVGVHFEANFIPLEVYINSRGDVSLGVSGPKVPTPIGTFSVHADVSFPDRNTLTIVAGNRKHVYDLFDQRFRVSIPSDRDGESRVEYDGKGNIVITISDPVADTLDGPRVVDCMKSEAVEVWVEANDNGLMVHAGFSVWNAMNKRGFVAAYFFSKDDSPLMDINGLFRSLGGKVSVGSEFVSPYDSARYNDFPLFMPYEELHLPPGIHLLKYSVYIFCMEPSSQVVVSGEGVVKVEI